MKNDMMIIQSECAYESVTQKVAKNLFILGEKKKRISYTVGVERQLTVLRMTYSNYVWLF